MAKTAVVYDKWLDAYGGGEVVSCMMAKILHEKGYDVTFISGKTAETKLIKEKLGIDLSGIKFLSVWNNETRLKQYTKDKDLFINCSFMDYSYGYAKKNIYYTHFPFSTESYSKSLKGIAVTKILPVLASLFPPIEIITPTAFAFSYMQKNKEYTVRFELFLPEFKKSTLEKISFNFKHATIQKKQFIVKHHENRIICKFTILPHESTIYLTIEIPKENIVLTNTTCQRYRFPSFLNQIISAKIKERIRAGLYKNIFLRIKSYDTILANSEFTKYWIKKYWKRDSKILYPPVNLLSNHSSLKLRIARKNWICSIGRFFTLGHGKKQEILIEAFKKLFNSGLMNYELHLAGGAFDDEKTTEYLTYLRELAGRYPIFFHVNTSRNEVEQILLSSKFYWHATGFGENEEKNPIKFEHFGISIIEAISAHCMPVVYKGGGLKEIIHILNYPKIHLFSSIDELVEHTMYLANTKITNDQWKKIDNRLRQYYSIEVFEKEFLSLI
jgi:hypothetical protein